MSSNAVSAEPNANFTMLAGVSVHVSQELRYLEYRRRWMENPRNFVVERFPIHLDIEATNRCNLKCIFCDKLPYLSPDEFGDMEYGLYTKIIDEGSDKGLCSIKLSYRGEPLLHPRLPDMIAHARKKGILDVYFNTNAMLLTESKSRSLIEAGLNRISISVEGTDELAFEQARIGAMFNRIKHHAETLLNLRESMGVDFPKVRIQTVALPGIDLEEYAHYWSPYCDEIAAIDYKEAEERDETLVAPDWACPQLWQRMTIEWDGRIMPCNNDDYRFLSPGNVNERSVFECWQDPMVKLAREKHMAGRSHEVESCNGCPWRTAQVLKKNEYNRNIGS